MTSAPVRSARYGMATDVSSPPEWARMTRSLMLLLPFCLRTPRNGSRALVRVPRGPAGELGRELCARGGRGGRLPGDDDDGVVAGDGADHLGQAGPVERAGQELRGAR